MYKLIQKFFDSQKNVSITSQLKQAHTTHRDGLSDIQGVSCSVTTRLYGNVLSSSYLVGTQMRAWRCAFGSAVTHIWLHQGKHLKFK